MRRHFVILNYPEDAQIAEQVLQPEREFEMKFERWMGERRNK